MAHIGSKSFSEKIRNEFGRSRFPKFFWGNFFDIFIDMVSKYLISFFLFLACSTSQDTLIPYIEPECLYTPYEISCIESLNAVRVSHGLQSLILHNGLSRLAMGHVEYLSSNHLVNHNYYGTRLYAAQGMGFDTLSENVAYGYSNVDSLISAWLKSDSHSKNLLDNGHTHHGFAIGVDSDGMYYYVHLFSR